MNKFCENLPQKSKFTLTRPYKKLHISCNNLVYLLTLFSEQQRPIVSSKIKMPCLTVFTQMSFTSFSVGNVNAPTLARQQGILRPESWNTLKEYLLTNFSIIMSSKIHKLPKHFFYAIRIRPRS